MDNQNIQSKETIFAVSMKSLKRIKVEGLAWVIFLTGVSYYCFAYLLRIYPGVMSDQLRSYFHLITAESFTWLTASYYFSYAPMQLLVGICVDRLGPRRSLLMASLVSTGGAALFAFFQMFSVAMGARFLMGLGASFAYVTALKLTSIWLPQRYFATAAGAVTGLGMIAAIFAMLYLTYSLKTFGFFYAIHFPIFVGLALFVLIFVVLRDQPRNGQKNYNQGAQLYSLSFNELLRCLFQIMKSRQIWLIGAVGALMYLPASVFLDSLAMPYLEHARFLSAEQAAKASSLMLMGWILSSFISGMLSDWFKTRKKPLQWGCFLAVIVSVFILYVPILSLTSLYWLMFVFGICCGPHPLCFALSKENYMSAISGTTVALTNFIIMMGGFVFQPLVGKILDWIWEGHLINGMRVYTAKEYLLGLSILPLGLLLGGLLTFFIKETGGKQKTQNPVADLHL